MKWIMNICSPVGQTVSMAMTHFHCHSTKVATSKTLTTKGGLCANKTLYEKKKNSQLDLLTLDSRV